MSLAFAGWATRWISHRPVSEPAASP